MKWILAFTMFYFVSSAHAASRYELAMEMAIKHFNKDHKYPLERFSIPVDPQGRPHKFMYDLLAEVYQKYPILWRVKHGPIWEKKFRTLQSFVQHYQGKTPNREKTMQRMKELVQSLTQGCPKVESTTIGHFSPDGQNGKVDRISTQYRFFKDCVHPQAQVLRENGLIKMKFEIQGVHRWATTYLLDIESERSRDMDYLVSKLENAGGELAELIQIMKETRKRHQWTSPDEILLIGSDGSANFDQKVRLKFKATDIVCISIDDSCSEINEWVIDAQPIPSSNEDFKFDVQLVSEPEKPLPANWRM